MDLHRAFKYSYLVLILILWIYLLYKWTNGPARGPGPLTKESEGRYHNLRSTQR